MRRRLDLPLDTSIALNEATKEVYIVTETGILRRPLFILDTTIEDPCARMRDLVVKVSRVWDEFGRRSSASFFRELLARGIVEYLDKMEEQNCLVKTDPSVPDLQATPEQPIVRPYTHCVLAAVLQYSEMSMSMVFLDRSPTPRATYQSNMVEASVGVSSLDVGYRGTVSRLLYPSRPLVAACTDEMLNLPLVPCVQNIVVAILPLRFNEEDAVVLSEEAI